MPILSPSDHHSTITIFMESLQQLPLNVLEDVLYFLPQNLLFNLALTNFHFYEPCLRKLYKKLTIQLDPPLKNTKPPNPRHRLDHLELSITTICGFSSVDSSPVAHGKMLEARLKTLAISILVNPTLASYIEEVTVANNFYSDLTLTAIEDFLVVVSSVPNGIHKLYVADKVLRRNIYEKLSPEGFAGLSRIFKLKSVCIDDLSLLNRLLEHFPDVEEVIIADVESESEVIQPSAIAALEKLKTLLIRDDPKVFAPVSSALWNLFQTNPFMMTKLKTFNVVHTHENSKHGYPYIDFENIENFQISLGCNDPACDQECLVPSLARFDFSKLKRLAVIQNSDSKLNSHLYCEKWDLTVFQFVKSIVDDSDSLFYLSIRHNVPPDGIIDDGYEGNYMRKAKLYTILLPNLLATIQRHVVNLVLPNLVAGLACYEQPMNTFLWNGCKCAHCSKHLEYLDDYLVHHRYYSAQKKVFKDILTTQLMRSLSEVLVDRMMLDANLGDLFQLGGPMRNKSWNFHNNKFSVPFLCLPVKTYEMAEFEDDKVEDKKGIAFDYEVSKKKCKFLHQEKFFPNYLIVVSHFLNDIIRKMINLNRGDAEDIHIGLITDENDGSTNLRINKMLVNGIDYNFDHELNGTIFFMNSFDGTDDE